MSRSYRQKDIELLWGLAAARCAYPNCKRVLVAEGTSSDPSAVIGKIAHIHARSDYGPRANPALSIEQRRSYENLILLCPTHHDLVDSQPATYTAEMLRSWKTEHELWVQKSLAQHIPDITMIELEIVCSAILNNPAASTVDFRVVDVADKRRRNHLTDRTLYLHTLGMAKAAEVRRFIDRYTPLDPTSGERLRAGFLRECIRLRDQEGLEGDSLFLRLIGFTAGPAASFERQAAGLAVLVYLFDICEVFER